MRKIVRLCNTLQFKLALCQLKVTSDKSVNILEARNAIQEAAKKGAQLVVLPEMWNCPYSNDSFPMYAEEFGSDASPSTDMMSGTQYSSWTASVSHGPRQWHVTECHTVRV
jgi:hypothetical protein